MSSLIFFRKFINGDVHSNKPTLLLKLTFIPKEFGNLPVWMWNSRRHWQCRIKYGKEKFKFAMILWGIFSKFVTKQVPPFTSIYSIDWNFLSICVDGANPCNIYKYIYIYKYIIKPYLKYLYFHSKKN